MCKRILISFFFILLASMLFAKPKARIYTEQDIDRLREKYDLGEGSFVKTPEGVASEKPTQKAPYADSAVEAQRRALQTRLAQAQRVYDQRSKECANLKTKVFLRDGIYDETYKRPFGPPLPFFDTIKKICDEADAARGIMDETASKLEVLR